MPERELSVNYTGGKPKGYTSSQIEVLKKFLSTLKDGDRVIVVGE
jgi:hypothetical protein